MTSGFLDRTSRWALIEHLARQLAADGDLAEAFERTPGKIARQLGVPADAIAVVLATLSRADSPPSGGDQVQSAAEHPPPGYPPDV